MGTLGEHLDHLLSDPEVASAVEAFAEADRIYREAVAAMGAVPEKQAGVQSAASVTISIPQRTPTYRF